MRVTPYLAIALVLLAVVALAPAALALKPPSTPEKGLPPLLSPTPALPEAVNVTGPLRIVASKEIAQIELFRVGFDAKGLWGVTDVKTVPKLVGRSGNVYVYETYSLVREPGLYDLYVKFKDGTSVYSPRSVWIIGGIPDSIRILHMSDLHFGAGDPSYKLTSYLLAQLLNATLIINTGDEADTADVGQYLQSLTYRYTFAYPVPEVLVPGNHDYPPGNFYKYYGNTTILCWRPLPWLLITGGYTWEIGHYNEEQLNAIEACLKANSDASVKIMLMHHPVFYWQGLVKLPPNYHFTDPHKDPHSPLSYYWGSEDSLKKGLVNRLLEMVVKYNVTMVLAGHIHRDQYVLYAPPGGGIHYFITTTTSGHSQARPNYNGVQLIVVYRNGTIRFPYAPPSFIGFKNASRARVYNSIPVDPHPARAPSNYGYIHANLIVGPGAYTLVFTNTYYKPFKGVVILPLPAFKAAYFGEKTWHGASVKVLERSNVTLPTGARYTFLALKVNLPPGSNATFLAEAVIDKSAPTAELEYTIPSKPVAGRPLRVFIRINDDSTGLMGQPVVEVYSDKGVKLRAQVLATPEKVPGDLFLVIQKTPPDARYVIVKIHLADPAGNSAVREVKISLAPPETGTSTTTTHTTGTPTHTTATGKTTATTATSPSTTTKTTRTSRTLLWTSIAVIVIIVVAAAALAARR